MKRSALFIGVNRYEDPEINPLQFAESDATELYAFFKHRAGYDDVRHLLSPDSDELLDTAHDMAASLAPDDLFLFFFAGHGVEYEGRHLLLCPKARYGRLKYLQHAVPLDLLKQETAHTGLHRVLILDACRTDLLKGHRGVSDGLRDVKCMREVVTSEPASAGSLAILCSCDEGQQAREVPQLRQGLFTRALLNVFEGAHRQSTSLILSDDLESNLFVTMRDLSSNLSMTTDQRPWIQKSGKLPVFLSFGNGAVPHYPSTIESVVCGVCGLRNPIGNTFRCLRCGRDHLCRNHLNVNERCCDECHSKKIIENQERKRSYRQLLTLLMNRRRQLDALVQKPSGGVSGCMGGSATSIRHRQIPATAICANPSSLAADSRGQVAARAPAIPARGIILPVSSFVAAGIASAVFELEGWMFAGVLLPIALAVSVVRRSALEAIFFPPIAALVYLMAFAFRYNAWEGIMPQIPIMVLMITPHIVMGMHLAGKGKQGS